MVMDDGCDFTFFFLAVTFFLPLLSFMLELPAIYLDCLDVPSRYGLVNGRISLGGHHVSISVIPLLPSAME
jgi:hypothetical protein